MQYVTLQVGAEGENLEEVSVESVAASSANSADEVGGASLRHVTRASWRRSTVLRTFSNLARRCIHHCLFLHIDAGVHTPLLVCTSSCCYLPGSAAPSSAPSASSHGGARAVACFYML